MNVRLLAFLLVTAASGAHAQGFDTLRASDDGFQIPSKDFRLSFPEDHGPHEEFRIEWWYVTANLKDGAGNAYGAQWTLFRSALSPQGAGNWDSNTIWMANAAVTSADVHLSAEKWARGGIGQAGVIAQPFEAWLDDWQLSGPSFDQLTAVATAEDFSYDLGLVANGPIVANGDQGYSLKSTDGLASHYYSQPFFSVDGRLTIQGESVDVTGTAWLDREWSSQILSGSQDGWDWLGLSFDDGSRLMGFQIRESSGPLATRGTWISSSGEARNIEPGALQMDPVRTTTTPGGDVPTTWRIRLREEGLDVTVTALNPRSWMATTIPYWEGPMSVRGSHTGVGYLEMTGYE